MAGSSGSQRVRETRTVPFRRSGKKDVLLLQYLQLKVIEKMTVIPPAKPPVIPAYHTRAVFRVRLVSTVLAIAAVCCFAVASYEYDTNGVILVDRIQPGYLSELDIFMIAFVSVTRLLYLKVVRLGVLPDS